MFSTRTATMQNCPCAVWFNTASPTRRLPHVTDRTTNSNWPSRTGLRKSDCRAVVSGLAVVSGSDSAVVSACAAVVGAAVACGACSSAGGSPNTLAAITTRTTAPMMMNHGRRYSGGLLFGGCAGGCCPHCGCVGGPDGGCPHPCPCSCVGRCHPSGGPGGGGCCDNLPASPTRLDFSRLGSQVLNAAHCQSLHRACFRPERA